MRGREALHRSVDGGNVERRWPRITAEIWTPSGGVRAPPFSDTTARKEFGLTQHEIVEAIRQGELQYRQGSMHGNPFLRLLRCEVEALVKKQHGDDYLKDHQTKTELSRIDRELKRLEAEVSALEARRSQLISGTRA